MQVKWLDCLRWQNALAVLKVAGIAWGRFQTAKKQCESRIDLKPDLGHVSTSWGEKGTLGLEKTTMTSLKDSSELYDMG